MSSATPGFSASSGFIGSNADATASRKRILVTGAGGFIGHHLVKRLKRDGHWVRGVDVKMPEYEPSPADEMELHDLRRWDGCLLACRGIDLVYHLAADMGGIGYISQNHADIARNNILMNAHMLEAAHLNGAKRLFFSSSACVYAQSKQKEAEIRGLREEDAYPADPEPGYGWEKLYAEEMCKYYQRDGKLETRVARFHNVYGTLGTFDGGREKAPAAICRKVARLESGGTLEVWGDGKQTRSFMHVDDCVEGILRLMASDWIEPLNLGTEECVTIDETVDMVARIANKNVNKKYLLDKPQGVRGRNSDNTRLRKVLGWEPSIRLEQGLVDTYAWIAVQTRRTVPPPRR